MGKKVAVSITLDKDLLRDLDALLGEVQMSQIKGKKTLSTRSSLIEQLIRDGIRRKDTSIKGQ